MIDPQLPKRVDPFPFARIIAGFQLEILIVRPLVNHLAGVKLMVDSWGLKSARLKSCKSVRWLMLVLAPGWRVGARIPNSNSAKGLPLGILILVDIV